MNDFHHALGLVLGFVFGFTLGRVVLAGALARRSDHGSGVVTFDAWGRELRDPADPAADPDRYGFGDEPLPDRDDPARRDGHLLPPVWDDYGYTVRGRPVPRRGVVHRVRSRAVPAPAGRDLRGTDAEALMPSLWQEVAP